MTSNLDYRSNRTGEQYRDELLKTFTLLREDNTERRRRREAGKVHIKGILMTESPLITECSPLDYKTMESIKEEIKERQGEDYERN